MSGCLNTIKNRKKVLQTIVNKELKKHHNGTKYTTKEVEGVYLIHENNKILVPSTLQERVMEWYHTILVHPGEKRMEESIRSIYTWKVLQNDVTNHCKRAIYANAANALERKSMDSFLKRKEN